MGRRVDIVVWRKADSPVSLVVSTFLLVIILTELHDSHRSINCIIPPSVCRGSCYITRAADSITHSVSFITQRI